ncbi:hypothetical protein ABK040_009072 [Willaertia magna]
MQKFILSSANKNISTTASESIRKSILGQYKLHYNKKNIILNYNNLCPVQQRNFTTFNFQRKKLKSIFDKYKKSKDPEIQKLIEERKKIKEMFKHDIIPSLPFQDPMDATNPYRELVESRAKAKQEEEEENFGNKLKKSSTSVTEKTTKRRLKPIVQEEEFGEELPDEEEEDFKEETKKKNLKSSTKKKKTIVDNNSEEQIDKLFESLASKNNKKIEKEEEIKETKEETKKKLSFQVIDKKPTKSTTTSKSFNEEKQSIASYTESKLNNSNFVSDLQGYVDNKPSKAELQKALEWGLKNDLKYNPERILVPKKLTPEELELKSKRSERLRQIYEEYTSKVSEEEEEERLAKEEKEREILKILREMKVEVEEDGKKISSQPFSRSELELKALQIAKEKVEKKASQQLSKEEKEMKKMSENSSKLNNKTVPTTTARTEISTNSETEEQLTNEEEKRPEVSTTIYQLNAKQYENAISNPEEFNKEWEKKGYTPVLKDQGGRYLLILYPIKTIGTSSSKQNSEQKSNEENEILETVKPIKETKVEKTEEKETTSKKKKKKTALRDVLVDETEEVDDLSELFSGPSDNKSLQEGLKKARNYFKEFGYDIADLDSFIKEEKSSRLEKKKNEDLLKAIEEEKKMIEENLLNENKKAELRKLGYSPYQMIDYTDIAQPPPKSDLAIDAEDLADDDPNSTFSSLEEQGLLLTEYETEKEQAMYSPDLEPFLYKTPEENRERLRKEVAKMSIGIINLPPELVEGVEDIIAEYPKNTLQKTAAILSATFRLRTGGFDNKTRLFSKSEEEQKIVGGDQKDKLFREQLDLLKKLRSYQPTSKKQKKLEDIQTLNKAKEDELDRAYNPQIIYKEYEAAAYIAHRLPAIYGTSYRVFSEVVVRMPDFEPKTMLDFGTGPGTAIWASNQAFGGSIREVIAVEPSTAMMDVATKLLDHMEDKPNVTWRRFLNENMSRKFDLVVASFVMNELTNAQERERIVKALWKLTDGVLVIVEPGTPIGFDYIREARATILSQKVTNKKDKASILAPCPHDSVCPMSGTPKWCHFAQRIEREQFQKITKKATKQYENEKFSFVAFRRQGVSGFGDAELIEKEEEESIRRKQIEERLPESVVQKEISLRKELRTYAREFAKQSYKWPRIVDTPLKRGGHVISGMCLPEGTVNKVIISKSDGKEGYKYLRKTLKGDLYPYPLTLKNLKPTKGTEEFFEEED